MTQYLNRISFHFIPSIAEVQKALNDFCLFRESGAHAFPINCNVFIYCSNGIGRYELCPKGTKYNPVVQGCDWPINFECKFQELNRK